MLDVCFSILFGEHYINYIIKVLSGPIFIKNYTTEILFKVNFPQWYYVVIFHIHFIYSMLINCRFLGQAKRILLLYMHTNGSTKNVL